MSDIPIIQNNKAQQKEIPEILNGAPGSTTTENGDTHDATQIASGAATAATAQPLPNPQSATTSSNGNHGSILPPQQTIPPTPLQQTQQTQQLNVSIPIPTQVPTTVQSKRIFNSIHDFEKIGIKTRKSIKENFQQKESPSFDPPRDNIESIPTYYPTEEQFKDPMGFIESINDVGMKYGAVKIIPPPNYDPGFSMDLSRLKFRAAKQSLNHPTSNFNEKIQFYKDLLQFHKSQKLPLLRLPSIDRRVLDLFKLRNSVHLKGGFELVCRKKLWAQIGRELGYTGRIMTSLSTSLKNSYHKVVHSYDLYLQQQDFESSNITNESNKRPLEESINNKDHNEDFIKRPKTEAKELKIRDPIPTISNSRRVFKRSRDILKAKGFRTNFESYTEEKQGITQIEDNTFPYYDFSYWHKGYEVLDYPYPSTEVSQLYDLDEFYESHLKFTRSLFSGEVSEDQRIERYQNLISSKSSEFNVESAKHLPSTVFGSGFASMTEVVESNKLENVTDPWNLNNLPLNEKGLMRYLVTENEPLTKPQIDIEMLYSTQSWAAEDHLLYSADYQHIGASKICFYISPSDQEKYENLVTKYVNESESSIGSGIIKDEFPEPIASDVCDTIKIQDQFSNRADTTNSSFQKLYEKKPTAVRFNTDFLIPFDILKQNDIKIYYTIQKSGQFLIKFPKTYSSSISLGFNINEHVNFATMSWLDHASYAENWLQKQGLLPCFSFFQLLTTIAEESKDSSLLKKVLPYYNELIEEQFELRSNLKNTVSNLKTINNKFDYITDDNLSMSFPTKIVVISGNDSFNLNPLNFIKLYQDGIFKNFKESSIKFEMHVFYSDDRLKSFQRTLSTYAQTPQDWCKKFEELLSNHEKPPIRSLKTLLTESERINGSIPEAETLKSYLDDANLWIEQVQDIMSVKQKNRIRNRRGSIKEEKLDDQKQITKPEVIEKLIKEIPNFSFTCPEIDQLIEFANEIYQFEITARGFLTDSDHTNEEFYDMIDLGKSFGVELKSVEFLERIVKREEWILKAEQVLKNSTILEEFEHILNDGFKLASKKDQELMDKVFAKYKNGKYLNAKFKHFLSLPSLSINIVEMLMRESIGIPTDRQVMADIESIKQRHAQSVQERDNIYKIIEKNEPELNALRDEKRKKDDPNVEFNEEHYLKLIKKFQGDKFDIRPKYSEAKDTLDNSRQFLPSTPSDPLDNYLRQAEEWLRKTKRLFGKTNAPFSVLRNHLTTIWQKDQYCFALEDKYILNKDEKDHLRYCFCRRSESGTMIACEKCDEWYHCRCLKFGRGKSKNLDHYICPICDYRLEIPREYNCPKLEDLEIIVEEGAFLEVAPDELNLVKSIMVDALNFRNFLKNEFKWDESTGEIIETDILKIKYYHRKLEGASVLLINEYNQLRQLIHKLDPICSIAPPIIESSNKTRKRRPRPSLQTEVTSTSGSSSSSTIVIKGDLPTPTPESRQKVDLLNLVKQDENDKVVAKAEVNTGNDQPNAQANAQANADPSVEQKSEQKTEPTIEQTNGNKVEDKPNDNNDDTGKIEEKVEEKPIKNSDDTGRIEEKKDVDVSSVQEDVKKTDDDKSEVKEDQKNESIETKSNDDIPTEEEPSEEKPSENPKEIESNETETSKEPVPESVQVSEPVSEPVKNSENSDSEPKEDSENKEPTAPVENKEQ
ncbi:hypothetical protein BN7_4555 [Wickerhamomyces ciferrii]|uniref:Uncharacterized protein n=1 Tax=Wickerhamomyces ciferrii (strain ATCC 14091 / BCRC 22168 / CBS 111 / JCM 3599 / NBRC 0793 / NRRL Y-1031 F-60-10) TaxID=1206466 RepID=K0KSG2_WICCF|nr:uncharacterized protein BN7_4555 [Wickerhamomyces ciferrii]CCH44977.1 hypothetical protein BN7_4555 [Wickerhamomyces ciferrii]